MDTVLLTIFIAFVIGKMIFILIIYLLSDESFNIKKINQPDADFTAHFPMKLKENRLVNTAIFTRKIEVILFIPAEVSVWL